MPDTASNVAGRRILLERRLIGVEALRFDFDGDSAAIRFSAGTRAMGIGLDGLHRVAAAGPLGEPNALVGLRGRWEDDDSFFLHIVFLHGARFDTLWHFDATGVSVEVEEPLASYRIRGSFQD